MRACSADTVIPSLSKHGVLPTGIHAATMAEIETRFATDDHRRKLWDGLTRYLATLTFLRTHGLMR